MLPQLMEQRESFLAFAKSRKNVEVVLKETRDWLGAADFLTTVTSEQIWRKRTPENVHNFAAFIDAGNPSLLLRILCICHKT